MKKTQSKKRDMKKFVLFSFLLFVCSVISSNAQDIHFSQFYMAPLVQNPALSGAIYDLQAVINYKDQWRSVAVPYKTVGGSFDMKLSKNKTKKGFLAAGINFFSDRAGDANMGITQANLNVAYHIRLNDYNTLGAGLQGGFAQRSISYGALQFGNQYNGMRYDASLPSGEPAGGNSFFYVDAGAGMVWTYNNTSGTKHVTDNHDLKFSLGAAVFHPHQPAYSFYSGSEKLHMKLVIHGNGLISIPNGHMAIVPGFMYYLQGTTQEIYAGSMIRYKFKQDSKYTTFQQGAAFSLGAYYRAQDAVAVTMLLEYSNYAIGVSYDFNTSALRTASSTRGGFEISLRFVNPNPFQIGGSKSSF